MARIEKNIVSYFPHDATASSGDTLTILQNRFGNDGYAVWFKLLEKLASSEGHIIDCRNPMRWQLLVAYFGIDEITTVEIFKLLVEIEAIDKELWASRVIWCQKLVDNVAHVYTNRRREKPLKPVITDDKPITTTEKSITTPQSTHSIVKDSIVDNSIVDKETLSPSSNGHPDWLNTETWEAFLEMRKEKKAVPSEKAKVLLVKELEKLKIAGDDPTEVLNQSIMNGWKGVFALKKQGGKYGTAAAGQWAGGDKSNPKAILKAGQFTKPEDFFAGS